MLVMDPWQRIVGETQSSLFCGNHAPPKQLGLCNDWTQSLGHVGRQLLSFLAHKVHESRSVLYSYRHFFKLHYGIYFRVLPERVGAIKKGHAAGGWDSTFSNDSTSACEEGA